MLVRREHTFLGELESLAQRHGVAAFSRSASSLSIAAYGPSGFDISLGVVNGICHVTLDGWWEEVEDFGVAAAIFERALNGEARLKVELIGSQPWRWTLESLDGNGNWRAESTVGHAVWRFWGRRSVAHLRNTYRQRRDAIDAFAGEMAAR